MEPFTLNRQFLKEKVIDAFASIIWTERYYGDDEVELVVPATNDMLQTLIPGTFLGVDGSNKIMILETYNIEQGQLKVTGISLLAWLNNRFVRNVPGHAVQYWTITGPPGWILWDLVYCMCVAGSGYLTGATPMGIPNPQQLVIPGLTYKDHDKTGDPVTLGVPFGPLYDALREIATTYEVGMEITLEHDSSGNPYLGFRSYRGLSRTSAQSVNSVVRFSPQMDSLANIKELQSIAAFKTLAFAFAPSLDDATAPLATTPGLSALSGTQYTGFDLRALLVFADDVTTDQVGGNAATLLNILNSRAKDALNNNRYIKAVDGEIVPTNQFKYGVDYNLGDIIEVQGNSDVVSTSRVIEYIRAQDDGGIKEYPTVAMLN